MGDKILEKSYDYLMRYENAEKKLLEDKVFSNIRIGREKAGFYDEKMPRIVMFGSFKAGKSTFVNALTGKKLAAVGPFEKTSWVARYWPSDEEFCHIEKKDGSIEEIAISEFVKNTQADVYDREYLSNIYRVDIGYKSAECDVALIDTPGFGASEENELRAIESVGEADLIFYMIDVNKLGKMREQAIVNKIRESKIPIVCIATKYDDDIAEDVEYERVKKIVAKHTGFDEADIYPVSVKNYLEGEDDSYFDTVVDLCRKVQINKIEYRKAAQQANLFRQSNSILSFYQKLKGEINRITTRKSEFQNQFFHYQKIVNDELSVFIKDYVRKTLYAEHKENIVQVIELSLEKDDADRNIILSKILPENYLEEYMEKLSKKVTEKQYELWNEKISELAIEYKGMMISLLDNKSFSNVSFTDVEAITNLGQSEKAFRDNGVKWSLGVAGFASFYEAVLGANAASVLLAGAAFTTGLPLAAGGLILTSYLLKKKRESGVTKSVIRGAVEKEILNFGNTVSDYCISRIEDHDREIFASYMASIDSDIQLYFPTGKVYQDEIEDCDAIIAELREFISSIEFSDDATDKEITLRKKNRQLEQECNGLTSEIVEIKKSHSNEIRDRDEKINGLEADNSLLQSQISDKDVEIGKLSKDCKKKESEICDLKTKRTELEKDKKNNEAAIATLNKAIDDKENELSDKVADIKRLEKEKGKLEKSNDEKVSEISRLKSEKKTAEKEYKRIISKKQEELEQKVEENSKLKDEIEDLKSKTPNVDGKAKLEQDICTKLDEFVHLGENKLRLTTAVSDTDELMDGLEDLILFNDEDLNIFLDDFKMLLKSGINIKLDGLVILPLIEGKYVIYRDKRYKAYCLLEGNNFTVKCVDVWNKDKDRYHRYKMQLTQAPILADDELKYRIFDEIKRAKKQIVIAVPWITQKAWEEKGNYKFSFEDVITSAINKNKDLKVYIITGNSGDTSSKSSNNSSKSGKDKDEETQFMIEQIKSRFAKKSSQMIIYGDCIIHDKILVVDDCFRMVGSYNMLSNQGIYGNGYERQGETMEINENPRNVKKTLAIASARANQCSDYFFIGLN